MTKRAYIGVGGKARKVKKIYVGADNFERRTLPEGYTQVEYIESSGTQYIDTGYRPNQNSRVVLDFACTIVHNSQVALYGVRERETSNLNRAFNLFQETTTTFRSAYTGSFLDFTAEIVARHKYDHNGRSVSLDDQYQAHGEKAFAIGINLFLFCLNSYGTPELYSHMKCYACKIYDNGDSLVRDFVPCTSPEGAVGLYDLVENRFYANAGTGAFTKGPVNKAAARKVKKAYLGVGGVARPVFNAQQKLAYYGTASPLSQEGVAIYGSSVGKYALLTSDRDVDAYSDNLIKSSVTTLPYRAQRGASASNGVYAFLGGGEYTGTYISEVKAYDSSLVQSTPATLDSGTYLLSATSVGGYVVFAGGSTSNGRTDTATAYNQSLVKSTPTPLSVKRNFMGAASTSAYALFAGGDGPNRTSDIVDAYSSSLVRSSAAPLVKSRLGIASASVGEYAIFGGGDPYSGGGYSSNYVDAYDNSLKRISPGVMSDEREDPSATSVGDYALFAGGDGPSNTRLDSVDVYTDNLVHSLADKLSKARRYMGAVSVGDYALFCGGYDSREWESNIVDAYTVI